MSVTIDVNDVFEEVVKQNERLVKEIEFYEEVVNHLITNVKTCIVCQQNDVINERISRLETHLKSKTIDKSTNVKSDDNDCYNKLKTNVKRKKLTKTKNTNKSSIEDLRDVDNKQHSDKTNVSTISEQLSDERESDIKIKTNLKTKSMTKKKRNLKIVFKTNNKTILKDIHEVDNDVDRSESTAKRLKIGPTVKKRKIKPYNDEYAEQRTALRLSSKTDEGFYLCNTCGYQNSKFVHYETHVNRLHLKIRPYNCDSCTEQFFGCHDLRHHKLDKHRTDLDQVIAPKSLACDSCDQFYSNRKSLERHRRIKHNIGPTVPYYYCIWKNCPFKSYSKPALMVHRKIHLGIRDFVCEWPGCEFKAVTKKNLEIHQFVHNDQLPYRCQWPGCEFRTKQELLLKRHINRVHEDIPRKLACHWPGCDKRFRFTHDLTIHLETHNEPHLPCPHCSKIFKTNKYLEAHLISHRKVKLFKCPVDGCETKISRKCNIKQHLSVHHKDWSETKT
ncbi:telomere zinc finger-associated protein-like [Oppia nitens]|uniref:telomere zinc finger-associated protein-like n=1 Tax=Oppia nitens TaxID=1686743 RepID=UPI0023DA4678|nr:telomere zinc finger-associated protein-like [Oppia nitens]